MKRILPDLFEEAVDAWNRAVRRKSYDDLKRIRWILRAIVQDELGLRRKDLRWQLRGIW